MSSYPAASYPIEVAVTIDGIPAHGDLPPNTTRMQIADQLITALKKHHVDQVYGFVVGELADNPEGEAVMRHWLASGHLIANHSYSHWDLAEVTAQDYINDIQKTERILATFAPSQAYKYFRYPYLSEGDTLEKHDAVLNWLTEQHYDVAPITLDFSDYLWNEAYIRCAQQHDEPAIAWLKKTYLEQALNGLKIVHILSEQLVERDVKNIFLLHLGAFSGVMLDDLLTAYENAGVTFISLPNALTDDIYREQPVWISKIGYSYLSKMRLARHLERPAEVVEIAKTRPTKMLNDICRTTTIPTQQK